MVRRLSLSILVLGLAFIYISCGGGEKAAEDLSKRKINIVTTIGMITDIAGNIGGERVNVSGLMGPGVDPHLYKASEGDVSRMANADIIFYNGLHLEGAMTEVFEQMSKRVETVVVSENIDPSLLMETPAYEGAHDPHIWFDVTLWIEAAKTVRDKLMEMDPSHADIYKGHAEDYIAELEELHKYVKEQAQRVPEAKRVLITAHDAFNYFGKQYGFEVRGLQGISTASEAGTADVRDLAQFIADNRIPAIFVESSVPKRNIEAVREAVKSRGYNVAIGGELFSDAMGTEGTEEGTYIGMVKHNIDTIVAALLGEA
ncbi:MAG: manganese transporter [candidate division Zixibacteria bacterium]|nr:manganese transporter [candidate division Zixibacteria bacterium]